QAFLVAAVFAVYWGTLDYPFQFDGIKGIENNIVLDDIKRSDLIWNHNPSRFLPSLSFAINRHLGGQDTYGYHLVNISLHAAVVLLLFYLTGLMFRAARRLDGRERNPGRVENIQFTIALLYAVHPLNTQAVTYIWQRCAIMAAVFYFLAMVAYLKSSLDRLDGAPDIEWKQWRTISLAAAAAAMITKQVSVTLPVALALLEYTMISGSFSRFRQRIGSLLPFLPLLFVVPFLTIHYQTGEVMDLIHRKEDLLSPLRYLLTQFDIIILYLKLLLLPVGQNLDHDIPVVTSFWGSAGSFSVLVAFFMAGVWLIKKNRMASFGVVFFFLAMSVESSFFPIPDIVFEHRMYLPSVGLYLAFASFAGNVSLKWSSRAMWGVAALALAVTISLSVATVKRNQVWGSRESLWADVVQKSPGKARAHINLASVKKKAGKYEEAEKIYESAVEVGGGIAEVHHDLGVLKRLRGDLDGAEIHLRKSRALAPYAAISALELGRVLEAQGRLSDAGAEYVDAANLAPRSLVARYKLADILRKSGNTDAEEKVYKGILELSPNDPFALQGLSSMRRKKGETGAAHKGDQPK
ncbi:MAG: tetratricopeptide repeat protein, partial [Nitrospinota bacterium]|nr:tetratricopeptide repeat protein [Nitrospinota bacterium]